MVNCEDYVGVPQYNYTTDDHLSHRYRKICNDLFIMTTNKNDFNVLLGLSNKTYKLENVHIM
jgi:hypothetical protein